VVGSADAVYPRGRDSMLKLILGSRQNETNRLLPNYPTDNAFHQSPFAKVTRPEKRNGLERTEVMEQSFHAKN